MTGITFTDYQQRVYDEELDLSKKRALLCDFMHSDKYVSLSAVDQGLMMVQLAAMDSYLTAINRRIEVFVDRNRGMYEDKKN